ncbi:MAG: DinB family protein [Acidimicrobiales bacterium]
MPEHEDGHNAPVVVDGEIATSLAFLSYLRLAVCRKLEGLSEDQARRAMVPSGTSLLGLVKHLTDVETYWIQRRFAGLEMTRRTDGFTVYPDDTLATVTGAYEDARRRTDEIVLDCGDPERPLALGTHGLTLRWALAHVTEETARHAGHADIVRELLDGTTGR